MLSRDIIPLLCCCVITSHCPCCYVVHLTCCYVLRCHSALIEVVTLSGLYVVIYRPFCALLNWHADTLLRCHIAFTLSGLYLVMFARCNTNMLSLYVVTVMLLHCHDVSHIDILMCCHIALLDPTCLRCLNIDNWALGIITVIISILVWLELWKNNVDTTSLRVHTK